MASLASFLFLLSLISLYIPFQSLAGAVPPPARPGGKDAPKAGPRRAMAPAPWQPVPGYAAQPLPKPLMKACVQTPFPDLCARALSFRVDPKAASDLRRLTELSTRVAIEAGTALASFGYVHAAGAKNDTRLRLCVRECAVRVDAAVKSLNASASALRRGARGEAMQLLGEAANGCGVCWGSCARFTGEAMHVMQKRARQFEKLVRIAIALLQLLIIGATLLP